jgi:hypothetical protein
MEKLQTVPFAVSAPPRQQPLFLLGVLLLFLGLGIYVVQFSMKQFVTPWHVPILGTLGVVLMCVSVWQHPGTLRIAGLVLFVLLCGCEWFFLVASKTPSYDGPAQPGSKMPVFAAALADGSAFTDKDLEKGKPSVLLFFRGRW